MTTLSHYGFDSYPYLHIARRRGLPYVRVLAYVEMLDRKPTREWMHDEVDHLDKADMEAIVVAWRQEMIRRYPLAGITDLATPLMVSKIIGEVTQ